LGRKRREELRIGDGDGIRGGHLLAREGLRMRKPFRIETDGNRGRRGLIGLPMLYY
jgi:hypothetical protein